MQLTALLAFTAALGAALLALAVARDARRSLPHWCFVAGMGLLSAESFFSGLTQISPLPEEMVHWQNCRLVVCSLLPCTWLCFSLTYARGNYRESLAPWRFVLATVCVVPAALALAFHGDLFVSIAQSESTHQWMLRLGVPGLIVSVVLLVSAVLVLMNLERTLRASVGTIRWRIKFMILGIGALFVVRVYTGSQVHLFRAVDLSLQPLDSAGLLVACVLILVSLLRQGPFKVDVYPSQAVLRNSITLLLAGIYLVVLGVLAKWLAIFGGGAAFQLKALLILIAVVLLAALLLSERLNWRIKRLVSRHFNRPLYDYRQVWRTFTEGIACHVEQADLCGAIARLVSRIFQAQSVTVWLADERKERLLFGASTLLSAERAALLQLDPLDVGGVIDALRTGAEPVDLDASEAAWASALRRCHPSQFLRGGDRFAVPLIAGGEWIGLITLGDRVGAASFSFQDLDLLKSVSEQAATSLLNVQFSRRLIEAKQLEAFQAMSAFFVHDLKNTASMLSLMLRNLPVHYEDPAFREDALRGISRTVTHLNDVISRLALLRQELAIRPVDCDLNQLAAEVLKGLDQTPGLLVVKDLQPLPKVRLDPIQMEKVLTNLVFNARDAVGPGGGIRVETSRRNGWAVLAVADNGCGMSPEFVKDRLFRPFQTTKKNGIGIGMFHCKLIVEAHHGRIEVESALGRGTSFRVLLPLAQAW
ncbi:MAG: XrtA/PEP-CTERM system histidine kinase PrsK [Limisphaerales bacterium]